MCFHISFHKISAGNSQQVPGSIPGLPLALQPLPKRMEDLVSHRWFHPDISDFTGNKWWVHGPKNGDFTSNKWWISPTKIVILPSKMVSSLRFIQHKIALKLFKLAQMMINMQHKTRMQPLFCWGIHLGKWWWHGDVTKRMMDLLCWFHHQMRIYLQHPTFLWCFEQH